eukprot:gene51816-26482_t
MVATVSVAADAGADDQRLLRGVHAALHRAGVAGPGAATVQVERSADAGPAQGGG